MSIIIDISEHQGKVDLSAAKKSIAGVIARCSYGWDNTKQIDKQWTNNAKQANELGIPLGAYHFAYARNAAEAKAEARMALSAIKGYKVRVLYYDMEYSAFQGNLTAEKAYEIAKAFCDEIEAAGIPVGIYANENWFRTKLTVDGFKAWTLWLANYGSNNGQDNWGGKLQYNPFGNVLLHQFTSLAKNGALKGIQGIPSEGLDASTDHGWLQTWSKDYVYGTAQDSVENKPTENKIAVGSSVRPTKAVSYDGVSLLASVTKNNYPVIELKGDRAVLGNGLNTAFHVSDLMLVTETKTLKVGMKAKPIKAVSYDGVSLLSSITSKSYTVIEVKGNRIVLGDGLNTAFNINNLTY